MKRDTEVEKGGENDEADADMLNTGDLAGEHLQGGVLGNGELIYLFRS